MKHTPGPWIVREWKRKHRTNKGELQFRYKYEVSDANGSAIECSTSNEANARLIAVAPEMLAWLGMMITEHNAFGKISEETLKHAADVIAKATGGSK